jgi:hypothetical protein
VAIEDIAFNLEIIAWSSDSVRPFTIYISENVPCWHNVCYVQRTTRRDQYTNQVAVGQVQDPGSTVSCVCVVAISVLLLFARA